MQTQTHAAGEMAEAVVEERRESEALSSNERLSMVPESLVFVDSDCRIPTSG